MCSAEAQRNKCEGTPYQPWNNTDNVMSFYKAERLRVMRMRQQWFIETTSLELKEAANDEMDVEVANDENVSSKQGFSVIPHRLACKRTEHPSSPFMVSNVKRMKCE
ncbi:hypothetical protein RB195_020193 [Necator americanus]